MDYNAPEPKDAVKLRKLQEKKSRYDNKFIIKRSFEGRIPETNIVTHWEQRIPAIPASECDVIAVGEVLDAQAYLSNDKGAVYSEFGFRVDEVLKNTSSTQLILGNPISTDRPGGIVQFPSGHKWFNNISGLGMPRIGRRYVLFLNTSIPNQPSIITGYELSAGRVLPLDDSPQMNAYKGQEEGSFLQAVRAAVAQPPQAAK